METNAVIEQKSPSRWLALDIVKGIGILGMIVAHSLIYWYIYQYQDSVFSPPKIRLEDGYEFLFAVFILVSTALVLLLPIASGAALRFFVNRYSYKDRNGKTKLTKAILNKILLRNIFLVLVGFFMNVLAWGWDSVWFWNILQFYAVASTILVLAMYLGSTVWVWLTSILSFISSFFITEIQALAPEGYLSAVLFGDPGSIHIWPLLPWLYVIGLGFWVGDTLIKNDSRPKSLRLFMLLGITLFITGAAGLFLNLQTVSISLVNNEYLNIIRTPASLFFISLCGFSLLLISVLDKLANKLPRFLFQPFVVIGQSITLIYVFHMTTAYWYLYLWVPIDAGVGYLISGVIIQLGLALLIGYLMKWNRKRRSAVIQNNSRRY